MHHAFELLRQQAMPEILGTAFVYRHKSTGARVLSVVSDDENKVFGISFRTPPKDSTGVAHIMEHSVLCGSKKYPVKEPFVELLKGSLYTFLNALTFPDKTCYPVASTNETDFYNLVDVYLDAVFHPNISEWTLKQEGWHYEIGKEDGELTRKGVVLGEMKGAYSSPDSLLAEAVQHSLFPNTTYGVDSGGDPERIPDLDWPAFEAFHKKHYHPSNAWAFFWGDDDPDRRLEKLDDYFSQFAAVDPDTVVPVQPRFDKAVSVRKGYPATDPAAKAYFTVNFLLAETGDPNLNLALDMLEHILIGLPSSPLRKALMDSGLGEDLCGVGLETDLRQMYFSVGLKGIHPANAAKVEHLMFTTLKELAENGIDPADIQAAVNSVEFALRERNTGSYPRGLIVMFQALSTWLYDENAEPGGMGDPLALLGFEAPLAAIKNWVDQGEPIFAELIRRLFLANPHRTTVLLEPDLDMAQAQAESERKRLADELKKMSKAERAKVVAEQEELTRRQEAPDDPAALAAIPRLAVADLDPKATILPHEIQEIGGVPVHLHPLDTTGLVYADLGFDLSAVPDRLLAYVPVFGRMLTECGTADESFVDFSRRIARETGGVWAQDYTTAVRPCDRKPQGGAEALFLLRGKSTADNADKLVGILRDSLAKADLANAERIRQIILEAKARMERRVVPGGHTLAATRLKARFHLSHLYDEVMHGTTNLFFLRGLAELAQSHFDVVQKDLEELRSILFNAPGMLVNLTADPAECARLAPELAGLARVVGSERHPEVERSPANLPGAEGLVIPAQVNYVAKGVSLAEAGFECDGAHLAATRILRTAHLWDKVRVQGGAYGAFTMIDTLAGDFCQVSYRDPNIARTLDAFDASGAFLRDLELPRDELDKAIIGAVGAIEPYMLPDAKGFTAFARYLSGRDDAYRQQVRDELLAATADGIRDFARACDMAARDGQVVVVGSREGLEKEGLQLTEVL